jgi:hypothetical protein
MNSSSTQIEAPPPAIPAVSESGDDGSERERLLATWRLHPDALVDLVSPEIEGEADDGAGLVRMTDIKGDDIDEFHFASPDTADEAVDYALRQINPGTN